MGYSAKQKKVKVNLERKEKIVKRLKQMGEAAGNVLMESAMAGGKIALEDAKRNCPVDTGALKNSLKLSKDKQTKKKATVKVDYDKDIKYGTFVELGVRGREANPFLRNAVDSNQKNINEEIAENVAKAVGGKM